MPYTGSMIYQPRVVDAAMKRALNTSGAVVLRGARAVGKTETARQFANSVLLMDSSDPQAKLAQLQPEIALEGETPRLLDEWQIVPQLWNTVRHAVDDRQMQGQFILSGSVIPPHTESQHSGAGRFRQLMMRTFTLYESGDSTGQVSLAQMLEGAPLPFAKSSNDFISVINRLVVGGWPGWMRLSPRDARERAFSYLTDICEHDFGQAAGPHRDPRRLMNYLRAAAALVAQPAPYSAMTRRMEELAGSPTAANAASELHDIAARLFLIEDQPAWSPELRSKTPSLQTPKRHLTDPSLAAALLEASPERLLGDLRTLGFLFESQVVHDVRVFAQAAGAHSVAHYRDSKGRDEIDIVVEKQGGAWIAIEVKLGVEAVDAAAANLLRVCAKMRRQPLAQVVIVPVGVAHRREDGVVVVPLTLLGP